MEIPNEFGECLELFVKLKVKLSALHAYANPDYLTKLSKLDLAQLNTETWRVMQAWFDCETTKTLTDLDCNARRLLRGLDRTELLPATSSTPSQTATKKYKHKSFPAPFLPSGEELKKFLQFVQENRRTK